MSTERRDPLSNLVEHMNARLMDFQQRPTPFCRVEPMLEQAAELARKLNGNGTARPPRNYLHEALTLIYTQGPQQALSTHLRYLCWALLEPWGQPPRRLLGAAILFPATLAELEKLRDEPLFRPLAWRGLLEAYFQYAPRSDDPVTSSNWRLLRDFLARELPRVAERSKLQPTWLQMIVEHRNLLEDNPCARYAPAVLKKNNGDIQRLQYELRIPESSWFWNELLLSQVRAVCGQKDNIFQKALNPLLEQLQQHESVRDDGLAMLLERYAQSAFKSVLHPGLRDVAIAAWRSPHLDRNARWGLVSAEAKRMVQKWLVVRALTDFFNLLQEDRAADERRLKFWLRYQESIDYFHFALGPEVYQSRQADYVAIRKTYQDQICRLTNPGSPGNNAFILKIGDYYFVEFGAVGNACYGYHEHQLPFKFSNSALNLNADLKVRDKAVLWLRHTGNAPASWEDKFEHELARLGIYSENRDGPNAQAVSLAHQAAVKYEDLRGKGGAFWIYHQRRTGKLAQQFSKLGFRYHEGHGWWRK